MERKHFLKGSLGLLGISAVIDACKKDAAEITSGIAGEGNISNAASCVISPSETEGPYPYPGGEINNPLNRSNVTEGTQTGIPLVYTFTVVNTNDSCAVVEGARVDIWHCNKDGYYSGYANQQGYLGAKDYTGQTWLRGYQVTDTNGKVIFKTIYPGWYIGRATHIHVEVYVNNVLKKTTQVGFTDSINEKVYKTSLYKAHGQNNTTNAKDNVFKDSITSELTALSRNGNTLYGSYTIGIAL